MTMSRHEQARLEDMASARLYLENELAIARCGNELLANHVRAVAAIHDHATQLRRMVLHQQTISRREIAGHIDRILGLCTGQLKPCTTNGKDKR
jgi:hypothetical protein